MEPAALTLAGWRASRARPGEPSEVASRPRNIFHRIWLKSSLLIAIYHGINP